MGGGDVTRVEEVDRVKRGEGVHPALSKLAENTIIPQCTQDGSHCQSTLYAIVHSSSEFSIPLIGGVHIGAGRC